jgi:hypothetical protein
MRRFGHQHRRLSNCSHFLAFGFDLSSGVPRTNRSLLDSPVQLLDRRTHLKVDANHRLVVFDRWVCKLRFTQVFHCLVKPFKQGVNPVFCHLHISTDT